MNDIREMYVPGTLWSRVLAATERALKRGALVSIPTVATSMEDHGIVFHVRVVANLARKAREARRDVFEAPSEADPFLPYEPDMFVVDLSETHVCLLNKYNVVEHHVLMVTRGFEHQLAPLTAADFHALTLCLIEYPGVVFYNAGETAGASQPHKHLQCVAEADLVVPAARQGALSGSSPVPLAPLVDEVGRLDTPVVLPRLPFDHRVVRFARPIEGDVASRAAHLLALYRTMLVDLGLEQLHRSEVEESARFQRDLPADATAPYNLVCTRTWMMMVPRRRECFETISVNALGFCGALLVRNEQERARLAEVGPMEVLKHTGRPAG